MTLERVGSESEIFFGGVRLKKFLLVKSERNTRCMYIIIFFEFFYKLLFVLSKKS
jgi:hypothetical protein